jgi:hypothetical protein
MKISLLFRILSAAGLAASIPLSGALADAIEAVPTAWRLENYVGTTGVAAWYTGSTCTNGGLGFNASATVDDKNRFWSLVMTAMSPPNPLAWSTRTSADPARSRASI